MNDIIEKLKEGFYSSNTAGQAADDLSILAGEYAYTCGQLEEILSKKPAAWIEIRPKVKSDTSAERIWENCEFGIKEMSFRLRMKSLEKCMSALKSIITIAQNELLRTK